MGSSGSTATRRALHRHCPLIGQLARRKWPIPAARTKAMGRSASSAAAKRLLRPELVFEINKPERVGWPISGFRARDLLVRQRTQCINALRGHLAEYGHV